MTFALLNDPQATRQVILHFPYTICHKKEGYKTRKMRNFKLFFTKHTLAVLSFSFEILALMLHY